MATTLTSLTGLLLTTHLQWKFKMDAQDMRLHHLPPSLAHSLLPLRQGKVAHLLPSRTANRPEVNLLPYKFIYKQARFRAANGGVVGRLQLHVTFPR